MALAYFPPSLPSQPPAGSLPGKKGNLETIKANGFHFQAAGWGRLLPGGLRRTPPSMAGAKGGPGGVGSGLESGLSGSHCRGCLGLPVS